ncbi:MAG TPA: NUDIX hydrolase [Chloroflexota bacterium]|nr:NUDIX hydrolase [Chloroflexota bacterium]
MPLDLLSRLAPVVPLLARIWRSLPERLQWRILWLLHPKFSVGVSGVVFDDAGRVMLLEHAFRRRYPWGLVSGWVKAGETLEDALRREAREETSLSISIERMLVVRKDRIGLALEAVFVCRLAGGTFRPSNEITRIQWCAPDQLPPGVHPHHGPLVRSALQPAEELLGRKTGG